MKLTRVIAINVIVASLGLGVVHAQSFSPMDSPAEFPPASYKGKQYVDRRGCVYIRAGIDGNVTWVPRVSRDRKVICGFKPTFDKPVAGTATPAKVDSNVVQIKPAAAPTQSKSIFGSTSSAPKKKTVAAPTPKVKTVAPAQPAIVATKPAPKPIRRTTKKKPLFTTPVAVPPATQSQTTPVAPTPTTRRPASQPPRAAGTASDCRGGAATHKGMKVRCGPQTELPYTPGTGGPTSQPPKMRFDEQNSSLRRPVPGTVVREGEVARNVRVVPKHVYEANLVNNVATSIPDGYRLAFDDGRLNPRRAEMTFEGKAQSDQIWERRLPRKLLRRDVGDGAVVARSSTVALPATTGPVVSTKSVPAEKALRLAGTPYVQVASFSDARSAQATAREVRKLGLPVRIGKFERGGEVQRMVLAGPFDDQTSAKAALVKTQGAGFSGAFLRR
ncbi:MAG: SPOR domain-containing protein [Shimia sp.]|uniref:SPOR domain-containing protein n=1 Tax=Shimia sp. TaxID=1954381 RepID=UPI004059861B